MEKRSVTNKSYYILSLAAHIRDGHVNAEDYPKYVIPYTPTASAATLALSGGITYLILRHE